MKKQYPATAFIFLFFCLILVQSVSGQTPTKKVVTPSPSPTLSVVDKLKKIEQLKDKIATKVAQLREEEKGALAGTVKKINTDQMTVTTRTGDRTVVFSDDTIVYSFTKDGKTETNENKIKEEQAIAVFGYFDEKKETLSAKYIYLTGPVIYLIGKIADIDKTNYSISVKELKGTTVVDIETASKTYIITKDNTLAKGGFSKFKIGDIVHVQGTPNPKRENVIVADRVITVSQSISPAPTISPTPTKRITPVPTGVE